jgi:hypothetical protein
MIDIGYGGDMQIMLFSIGKILQGECDGIRSRKTCIMKANGNFTEGLSDAL